MGSPRRAQLRIPRRIGGRRGCRGYRTGSASRLVSRALTTTAGAKVRASCNRWKWTVWPEVGRPGHRTASGGPTRLFPLPELPVNILVRVDFGLEGDDHAVEAR